MITLTTPHSINSVLGGNVPVAYGKLVIAPIDINPLTQEITASLVLTSTTVPEMQAISGSLIINIPQSRLEIGVGQLDFYRKLTLSTGQKNQIQTIINNAQNGIEAGLTTLGVIAGTQSTGV